MDSEEMIARVREAIKAIDVRVNQNVEFSGLSFEIKFSVHGQELAIVASHGTTSIRLANKCRYLIKGTIDESVQKEIDKYDKKARSGSKNLPNADEVVKVLDAAVIYFRRVAKEIVAKSVGAYNVISFRRDDGKLTSWQYTPFHSTAPNGYPIFNMVHVDRDRLTNQFRVTYPHNASDRKWKAPEQALDIIAGVTPELVKAMSNPKFFEENVGDPTIL